MKIPGSKSTNLNGKSGAAQLRPSLAYIRKALGSRAERLLVQFHIQNGRFIDQNYSKSVAASRQLKYTFHGQIIPPLVLTTPEEVNELLTFYPVRISAEESERSWDHAMTSMDHFLIMAQAGPARNLRYLDNFLLVLKPNGKMVFISDDHTHSAYAFTLAKHLGAFGKDPALFQFDEHEDNVINTTLHSRLARDLKLEMVARCCKSGLEIHQFLAFACHIGLLKKEDINYVLTANLAGKMGPLPPDKEPRLEGGKYPSLGQVPEAVENARKAGKKTIMSLDLDLLAYLHDPLFPAAKKEKVKAITEEQVMAVLEQTAKEASFITIALSPDYFNVPETVIRRIIGGIVEAA